MDIMNNDYSGIDCCNAGKGSMRDFQALTEALGFPMALTKAREAFVHDLMVSVLPYLYHRVAALSYIALDLLYNLWR